ncbi:MAG: hypothetical protein WDO69_01135 [Pseudomonadota bacterium]
MQVSAGNATCALLESGNVRCWGFGFFGSLGYGNTNDVGDDETPASVGDVNIGAPVAQIATGQNTCALLTNGNVRCWGRADAGLGYMNQETIGDNETPASAGDVNVGASVAQVAVGTYHVCAVLTSGALRCWRANQSYCPSVTTQAQCTPVACNWQPTFSGCGSIPNCTQLSTEFSCENQPGCSWN